MVYRRVGIFGMGLLGGSVALALRERGLAGEVHAYDLDPASLEAAQALGAADVVHTTLGAWVGDLDLGVLAAPVRALAPLATALAPLSRADTLWIDVGSVKAPIADTLTATLPRFVPTHPMAGRETPGVANAFAGLLQSAVWVTTPTDDTAPADLAAVRALIEALGAYPVEIPAEAHDRLVARVSHLPYLVAVALNLLIGRDPDHERLMFLAAGGFRDITRVASGAPEMSRDMVCENRDALRDAVADMRGALDALARDLDAPDAMLAAGAEAKRTRDALPVVRRSLLPRIFDLVVALPDRPNELARLTTVLGDAGVNIRDIEVLKVRGTGGEAIRVGLADAEALDRARDALTTAGYRVK